MTAHTLKEAFQTARDRLLLISKLAVQESVGEFGYADEQGATYPYFEVVFASAQRQRDASNDMQRFTIPSQIILWCDVVEAGYQGELQDKIMFEWLPDIMEYFEAYGNLKTPDALAQVPYYQSALSGVGQARVTIGQSSDNRQVWQIVFDYSLVFQTMIRRKC